MTPLVFILLCCFCSVHGQLIYQAVVLGDPANFTFEENCEGNIRWIFLQSDGKTRPVGENRIQADDGNVSLVFNRTTFNDKGVYEYRCDDRHLHYVQLDILVPHEVSVVEGQDATLPCYSDTTGTGTSRFIRWERDGKLVLEKDVVSGNVSYGPGFAGRVSVSSDGFSEGVLSLILNGTRREDQGGFYCYHGKDETKERGHPSAVRLTVTGVNTVNTVATVNIPTMAFAAIVTIVIIVIFALLVVLIVLIVLGLKYRRLHSKVPSSTGGAASSSTGNVQMSTLSRGNEMDPLHPPAVNGSAPGAQMDVEGESCL